MLEAALVRKILKNLREKRPGGFWVKIHGGPTQQAGLPDILGCWRGQFVAFEVKRPDGGDATPIQAHTIKQIINAGGVAIVIRSVQEAFAILDGIDSILGGSEE